MADKVDTTGTKVDDYVPYEGLWPEDDADCDAVLGDLAYFCTAPRGHAGPHVAEGMDVVVAVWDQ